MPQPEAMHDELVELLEEAREGELSPEGFSERLRLIHARFLGDELDSPGNTNARSEALKAYERLIGDIDRHHQTELLATALGIQP